MLPAWTQAPSQRSSEGEVLTTGLQATGTWINGINEGGKT